VDAEFVRELFTQFGSVSLRRMFGGAGIYADGLMFGLITSDVIYLKADDSFIPLFEREGQTPFKYKSRDGQRTLISYWRMPERLYDDPDELAQWAHHAMAEGQDAGAGTPPPEVALAASSLRRYA